MVKPEVKYTLTRVINAMRVLRNHCATQVNTCSRCPMEYNCAHVHSLDVEDWKLSEDNETKEL